MKIMLDPGHGGKDDGATYKDLKEKDVVLNICRIAQDTLQYKHWIAMTRNEDIYVPIMKRVDHANMWGADVFISVHCNADPDADLPGMPEAKGEEIWINQNSFEGKRLAQALRLAVDRFFPENHFRGIKQTTHLGVLKYTRMPAALIEVGFLDNSATAVLLNDPGVIKQIGQSLVSGILRYALDWERGP